jgi:putative endonuclease
MAGRVCSGNPPLALDGRDAAGPGYCIGNAAGGLDRDRARGTKDGRRRSARPARCCARYLDSTQFRVLEANVRCGFGEIDLVAIDAGVIVFVEVKSKRGGIYGAPEEMVTPAKQRRLTRLAAWYLQRRSWLGRPARSMSSRPLGCEGRALVGTSRTPSSNRGW